VVAQPDGRQVAAPDCPVDAGDVDAELVRDLLRRQPQVALMDICRHTPIILLPFLPFLLPEVRHSERMRLPIDEARLLPRFRDRVQLERQQGDVFREEFERAGQAGIDTTSPRARRNDGPMVSVIELRGLPCLAAGVRGVQPGTDPLGALIWKERRRRRG
jgi:hypothetical protein